MRWFGPSWNAPINDDGEQVETPQGEPCGHCGIAIHLGDQGLLLVFYGPDGPTDWPIHLNCLRESTTPTLAQRMRSSLPPEAN